MISQYFTGLKPASLLSSHCNDEMIYMGSAMNESHSRLPPLRIPMSYLVPATLVAAFTSLGRATSRAIRKGAVLLFSIVVLLDGGAATTPAPTPMATLTPTPSTTPAQGFA